PCRPNGAPHGSARDGWQGPAFGGVAASAPLGNARPWGRAHSTRSRRSDRPVGDRQTSDGAEVALIAREEGDPMHERHGGDPQVLCPLPGPLGTESLILGFTAIVEAKDRQRLNQMNRAEQERVAPYT